MIFIKWKKFGTTFLAVFVVLFIVLSVTGMLNLSTFLGGVVGSTQGAGVENLIFANNFDFICCGEQTTGTGTANIATSSAFLCNDKKCDLSNVKFYYTVAFTNQKVYISPQNLVYYVHAGNSGCQGGTDPFLGNYFKCNSGERTYSNPPTLNKGDILYFKYLKSGLNYATAFELSYDKINDRLAYCGTSACDAGKTGQQIRLGSCSYTFGDKFGTGGYIDGVAKNAGESFILESGQCLLENNPSRRQNIGTLVEQCNTDSDCPIQDICSYNKIQNYGCVTSSISTCTEWDYLPDGTKNCKSYGYEKRCEVKSFSDVECCPGSNICGSNAACENYKCVPLPQAECQQDRDCGLGEFPNADQTQLVKKVCVAGKCQQQVVQNIECYYDSRCPEGYYCNSSYKCEQRVIPTQECPYECCVDYEGYRDKPPASGKQCCSGLVKDSCTAQDEICGDEIDNDGDGRIDEDCENEVCIEPEVFRQDLKKCACPEGTHLITIEQRDIGNLWGLFPGKKIRDCQTDADYTLIAIAIIAGIAAVASVAIYTSRKKIKKRKKRKKRK